MSVTSLVASMSLPSHHVVGVDIVLKFIPLVVEDALDVDSNWPGVRTMVTDEVESFGMKELLFTVLSSFNRGQDATTLHVVAPWGYPFVTEYKQNLFRDVRKTVESVSAYSN